MDKHFLIWQVADELKKMLYWHFLSCIIDALGTMFIQFQKTDKIIQIITQPK